MTPSIPTRTLTLFGLLLLAAGCTMRGTVHTAASAPPEPFARYLAASSLPLSSPVVVISIDGLRPDAIERFHAPTLQRLAREGSHSFSATTILPSITLPSHVSMLTGVEPEVHGVDWNDNLVSSRGHVEVPTIFATARQHGLSTAGFFSKGKFEHILAPETLDHAYLPTGDGKWLAARTTEAVERHLASERPDLLFVHFGEPDYAGHLFGWMGGPYRVAVRVADAAVARVLTAAERAYGEENFTVLITADHGGHGRSHGTDAREDQTIPWIAWGKGVRPGHQIESQVRTTDTAATALWLLGVESPGHYSGRPVTEAFAGQGAVLADRPVPNGELTSPATSAAAASAGGS